MQQAPCVGGQKIEVKPTTSGLSPGAASGASSGKSPPPNQPGTATVTPLPPPVAAKSAVDTEAELCLDFIRPFLKDPRSAYYEQASKGGVGGTVLSLIVYSKNSYGGVVSKPAKCEIKNGVLDSTFTLVFLKEAGWEGTGR